MSDSLWPCGLQHASLPCPSPTLGAYSNSCPLSRWCHPTISSFVFPFSSCLQSFPASGSFPMSQFFASGGHSMGVSASASGRFRRNLFPCVFQLLETAGSPCLMTPFLSLQSRRWVKFLHSILLTSDLLFSLSFPLLKPCAYIGSTQTVQDNVQISRSWINNLNAI